MKNRMLICEDFVVLLSALVFMAGCGERTRAEQVLLLPEDEAAMDTSMGDSAVEDSTFDQLNDSEEADGDTGFDLGSTDVSQFDLGSTDVSQFDRADGEEEDCAGPDFESDCVELASVEISNPVITYEGGDSAWQPGEELVVQLRYRTTGEDVGYPSISPSTNNPLAMITYFSPTDLFVLGSESEWEPVVKIYADPSISPGTEIRITVDASLQWGEIVACDCPDYEVDSWSYKLTMQ